MNRGRRLVADETHDLDDEFLICDEAAMIRIRGRTCQICANTVEITVDGELFDACKECGFLVCRTCYYEYQRREGNQACPRCHTRYNHINGSPRVEGDEEDIGSDEICGNWNWADRSMQISGLLREITTLERKVQMLELEKGKHKPSCNAFWVVSFLLYVVALVFVVLL